MTNYIIDLSIVALGIIGITAFMGSIANGIGEKIFGGKRRSKFVNESAKYQTGWKQVGGNQK